MEIPGREIIEVRDLVLDFNGTIAKDGRIHNKVKDALCLLGKKVTIHVLTADTRGNVAQATQRLPVMIQRLEGENTAAEKAAFVKSLGSDHVIAIGNGFNDRLMLKEARLGLCVLGEEGTATEALLASDVAFASILDALRFILKPLRHRATLRS
ncbi:MAG: ATPase P [Deltaproteobacteria bacterium]|nr:MAG: ATPase P [Deltaproteobacteria bacterium]